MMTMINEHFNKIGLIKKMSIFALPNFRNCLIVHCLLKGKTLRKKGLDTKRQKADVA